MSCRFAAAALCALLTAAPAALAAEVDVTGTWRLVSSTRKVVDTEETGPSYGERPTGWLTHTPEGRVVFLLVYGDRPRPESIAGMTDADRARLHRTMIAFGGTYAVSGSTLTYRVDTSWNEVWTGQEQVRDVERSGDGLVLTTRPAPFSGDGRVSVVMLTFEKVK